MPIPLLSTLSILAIISTTFSSPFPSPPLGSQFPMSPTSPPTIYLAYGSNLWLHQMTQRCPSSTYTGLARLPGYKWLINTRGYANVVEKEESEDEVWGMVYTLSAEDEQSLDKNEGVPVAYSKEYLNCEFWSARVSEGHASSPHEKIDVSGPMTDKRDMLVYIDRVRTTAGVPREEYVYRMNRGIEDALGCGVPGGYVEGVVREFIPEDGRGDGKGKEEVEEFAKGQARGFRDESGVIE